MPIDLTREHAVPFSAVSRIPWISESYSQATGRRTGSARPHVATIHRWANRGIRGVKLEYVQLGGTRVTSQEALQRFFHRLTEGATKSAATPQTQRKEHRYRVNRELDSLGLR